MNPTKNASPKSAPVNPAPLGKFWKGYTSPSVYEVTQAVTADGEWMIERQENGTWFVGHLPTRTEVKGGHKTLRAARVYIAKGLARAGYDAIVAEMAAQVAETEETGPWQEAACEDWQAPAATDSVILAHVADAIEELTGDDDCDAAAQQAAELLARVPSLAAEVAKYGAYAIEWEHLTVIVQAALKVPAAPLAHFEDGPGTTACGWIQYGETTTVDPARVTCRFCKSTVNANRIVAELALSRPPF